MKSYHLAITEPADADLKEIADYITHELKEPNTAQHLLSTIAEAVSELEQMPEWYALVEDKTLANQGIRKMVVNNYIVFYVISEKNQSVTVIRVLYARRDWNNLL